MPQNQVAQLSKAGVTSLEVVNAPYHWPLPNEVIIKNHAVAINPVDWKMQDRGYFTDSYPAVFGCDVAGTIEAVGRSVTTFQPGDRVMGQAEVLSLGPKYAAFQSYVPCPVDVVCKIPDALSFTQACILPLSINTAVQGLFTKDNLNLPHPSTTPTTSDKIVFIYGGSTSVGSSAIQLAKAAGATVIVTAGKANHQYCRDLGADHVLDYKTPGWVDEVASLVRVEGEGKGREFAGIYDTIADPAVFDLLADLVSRLPSPVPIASVGAPPEGFNVKANNIFGTDIVFDEGLARAIWVDFLPGALAEGTFVCKPEPLVCGEGLRGVQAGIDAQRRGVSARKCVVKIL